MARYGAVAQEIVVTAREIAADPVIVTAGRSGTTEGLVGAVASQIVRQAPCSVLMVRG